MFEFYILADVLKGVKYSLKSCLNHHYICKESLTCTGKYLVITKYLLIIYAIV
ncbi:Uncharacterised protein [Streptococcus pneumoniae]|nr:Uncharacterised protein [Streptococcus pneumoniae]